MWNLSRAIAFSLGRVRRRDGEKSGQFASGEIRDYWFSFVNAVAREVRRTQPDKFTATPACWTYLQAGYRPFLSRSGGWMW